MADTQQSATRSRAAHRSGDEDGAAVEAAGRASQAPQRALSGNLLQAEADAGSVKADAPPSSPVVAARLFGFYSNTVRRARERYAARQRDGAIEAASGDTAPARDRAALITKEAHATAADELEDEDEDGEQRRLGGDATRFTVAEVAAEDNHGGDNDRRHGVVVAADDDAGARTAAATKQSLSLRRLLRLQTTNALPAAPRTAPPSATCTALACFDVERQSPSEQVVALFLPRDIAQRRFRRSLLDDDRWQSLFKPLVLLVFFLFGSLAGRVLRRITERQQHGERHGRARKRTVACAPTETAVPAGGRQAATETEKEAKAEREVQAERPRAARMEGARVKVADDRNDERQRPRARQRDGGAEDSEAARAKEATTRCSPCASSSPPPPPSPPPPAAASDASMPLAMCHADDNRLSPLPSRAQTADDADDGGRRHGDENASLHKSAAASAPARAPPSSIAAASACTVLAEKQPPASPQTPQRAPLGENGNNCERDGGRPVDSGYRAARCDRPAEPPLSPPASSALAQSLMLLSPFRSGTNRRRLALYDDSGERGGRAARDADEHEPAASPASTLASDAAPCAAAADADVATSGAAMPASESPLARCGAGRNHHRMSSSSSSSSLAALSRAGEACERTSGRDVGEDEGEGGGDGVRNSPSVAGLDDARRGYGSASSSAAMNIVKAKSARFVAGGGSGSVGNTPVKSASGRLGVSLGSPQNSFLLHRLERIVSRALPQQSESCREDGGDERGGTAMHAGESTDVDVEAAAAGTATTATAMH